MNKFIAVILAALVAVVAVAHASGYGQSYSSGGHSGYSAPSYGQNYDRKTGFKTVSDRAHPTSINLCSSYRLH